MKSFGILLIISTIIVLTSCEEEDKVEGIDCEVLSEALVNSHSENLKVEIDKLTSDLKPHVSNSDSYGHNENLITLINRLNSQCENIEVSIECYACIKTNPPQSEISISIDSLGIEVCRIIDILTADDKILSFSSIHQCY